MLRTSDRDLLFEVFPLLAGHVDFLFCQVKGVDIGERYESAIATPKKSDSLGAYHAESSHAVRGVRLF